MDSLKERLDDLGWTAMSIDEEWKMAAWRLMRELTAEVERLSRRLAEMEETGV